MNLTEEPELVNWPETYYAFVEKVGPFRQNAPAAWSEVQGAAGKLREHNRTIGAMSLYKPGPQVYRAGFVLDAPPSELPEGLQYEKFAGGRYSKFTLTGSYAQLPEASGRVSALVAEQGIAVRDGFYIENYVGDPKETPESDLVTEILVPTEG